MLIIIVRSFEPPLIKNPVLYGVSSLNSIYNGSTPRIIYLSAYYNINIVIPQRSVLCIVSVDLLVRLH